MRIVVANVNTTVSMTEGIRIQAERYAAPDTEILAVTPFFGPPSVESYAESHVSAVAVLDRIAAIDEHYDAIVEAGFGENAKPALEELVSVPVISITESAALVASMLGRQYSVVTTTNVGAHQIRERLLVAGLSDHLHSVRPSGLGVLELEDDEERSIQAIVAEARRAVDEGADVICLGCAGMVTLQERVAAAIPVPVVDGVAAAIKMAESVFALGLARSESTARAPHESWWPLRELRSVRG